MQKPSLTTPLEGELVTLMLLLLQLQLDLDVTTPLVGGARSSVLGYQQRVLFQRTLAVPQTQLGLELSLQHVAHKELTQAPKPALTMQAGRPLT